MKVNVFLKKITDFRFFYETVIFVVTNLITCIHFSLYEDSYYFHFFLLDYSHGYMTRGFLGEVVSLFTDTVTRATVLPIVLTFLVLLNLCVSLLLGKLIHSCEGDTKNAVIFISALLIFSPMTLYWLAKNGMQADLYFFALTLMAVLVLRFRGIRFLVPVFCVIATLVSVVYPVHCMTLVAIILFYEFSKKKSFSNGLLCVLTYAGIIGVALYAVMTRGDLTFETADELMEYMYSKIEGTGIELHPLIEYYIAEYVQPFSVAVNDFIGLEISNHKHIIFTGLLFVYLPFFAVFTSFWAGCIKKTDDKFMKTVYVFAILAMVLVLAPSIFTGEPGRWTLAGYVIETGLLFYFIYDRNECVCERFSEFVAKCKEKPYITVSAVVYAALLAGVER